ncbi:MAG: sigma-54-dependent Fis family transcriptional regulator [Deltaproteobacteria bacterium]|nr:sigma-54-dependent Fis family transcriptional regulator [Nannocystaceae bacterium]
MRPHALVVDDDDGVRYTLVGILEEEGVQVSQAASGEAALALLDDPTLGEVHLVVTDMRMPGMSGLDLLAAVRQRPHAPKVVMITAHGSERLAVEATKAGAYDYFRKPFELEELIAVVRRALETVRLEVENEQLRSRLALSRTMVFVSEAMSKLAVMVHRVAPRDVTVLIRGESGTGKERVAEAIVAESRRASRPFVRFNCAALTPELAEAELFGHSKGAFTGAVRTRSGLFREADGGTILLDEVGELDLATQAKLLRVLQEHEIRPVGEDHATPIDVRVIAATHRDLSKRVEEGAFREDLYYRLHVVELQVPPLRDRPEDVAPLVRHFLERFTTRFGLDTIREPAELVPRLTAMPWPGNVRELENTIESLVALSDGSELDLDALAPLPIAEVARSSDAGDAGGLRDRVDAFERQLLVDALASASGNRSEAARALGIGRATLHDKLRKHGLGEG